MMAELERVTALVREMLHLEAEIAEMKERIDAKDKARAMIAESDLPELMDEVGLSEVVLGDGRRIIIAQEIYAHISENNKPTAFSWLRLYGHDDIIKRDLTLRFGKGEDEKARKLYDELTGRPELSDNTIISKESVHGGTLKAFVRRELERGTDIPHETFGIFEKRVAKVDTKKVRKKA
jgi:hypothetical protein